jgi:hypothetical protein
MNALAAIVEAPSSSVKCRKFTRQTSTLVNHWCSSWVMKFTRETMTGPPTGGRAGSGSLRCSTPLSNQKLIESLYNVVDSE